jgi:hypothetical protein
VDSSAILQQLADDEIGFQIESIPCIGFNVRLGDEMNGFAPGRNFKRADEAIRWLGEFAIIFPQMRSPSASISSGD